MKLHGWKAIAEAIGKVWEREVSVRSAQHYEAHCGLTVNRFRGCAAADSESVTKWAREQWEARRADRRDRAPAPDEDQHRASLHAALDAARRRRDDRMTTPGKMP